LGAYCVGVDSADEYRSNIGNAKAAGLQTDLKLSNTQYSIALTVTYVPYTVAELPLTLAIRKM
jgi:hypothetical protein